MIGAMAIGAGIGALGNLANTGLQSWLNNYSVKKAAKMQYNYWKKSQKEGPSLQRQGLEDAGYNPMLALSQGGASYGGSVTTPQVSAGDFVGSVRQGAELAKEAVKGAKAQIENIEADTRLKEGQLSAVETQRLQTEANTSLLQSQTERSDLAYGRDIADTITAIAETGATLYSAKAAADVAKQNAAVNARNATVRERMLDTHTTETHYDGNGKKKGTTERMTFSHGEPAVNNSANPNVKPNSTGLVGSSAKSAGSIAKQVAKELLLESVIGTVGAGAGALAADNLKRDLETGNHWNPKDRNNGKEKARRKWSLYHDIGF